VQLPQPRSLTFRGHHPPWSIPVHQAKINVSNNFPPVHPHAELTPIMDDVWFVQGSVPFKPLIRLPRNMVVVRHEGELTLINAVRLNAEGLAALDALGTVRHIMKPGFHEMDDAFYLDRYEAKYWTVAATATGSSDLAEGAELPVPHLRVFRFEEVSTPEAALLLDRDGGLLITCDSVQHWAPSPFLSFVAKLVTKRLGFVQPAQIGPPWRGRQTPPGGNLRPDFVRLAALPFDRLIGGHGGVLDTNASAILKQSIIREFGEA
jgi:hypothetical protein